MTVDLGDLINRNANVVLLLFVHHDIEMMEFEFYLWIIALLSRYVCRKNDF